MVTRTLTNAGDPLLYPDGTPAENIHISFTLVKNTGLAMDVFDATTFERIAPGPVHAITDATGVFSIDLFPTSRADQTVYYLCVVPLDHVHDVVAVLPEGGAPLSWILFCLGGAPATPAALDALAIHLASTNPHPLYNNIQTQPAAGTMTQIAKLIPAEAGAPPFQIQMQSFTNPGGGHGINNGVWFGWNASRHTGNTGTVAGKRALAMGFESNYYDNSGDNEYAAEWYIEGWSPNGTTVPMSRPFYARGAQEDDGRDWWTILCDIGSGVNSNDLGQFTIRQKTAALFNVTAHGITCYKILAVEGANIDISGGDLMIDNNRQVLLANSTGSYLGVLKIDNQNDLYFGDVYGNIAGAVKIRSAATNAIVLKNGKVSIGDNSNPQYPLDILSESGMSIGATGGATGIKTFTVQRGSPYNALNISSRGDTGGWYGRTNLQVSYNNNTLINGLSVQAKDATNAAVGINTLPDPTKATLLVAGDIQASGPMTSTGGGIGYATGAGGTQAQATSKATGVTLNKLTGTITLNGAALAAATTVGFVFTNSFIAATDLVMIVHDSVGTLGAYGFAVTPAAGSATISVRNLHTASLSEAIVLRFAVIKSVVS